MRRQRSGRCGFPRIVVFVSLWATYRHMYTNPGLPVYAFGPALTRFETAGRRPALRQLLPRTRHGVPQPANRAGLRRGRAAGQHGRCSPGCICSTATARSWRRASAADSTWKRTATSPPMVAENFLRHEAGRMDCWRRLGVDGILIVGHDCYPLVRPAPGRRVGKCFPRRRGGLPPASAARGPEAAWTWHRRRTALPCRFPGRSRNHASGSQRPTWT